MGRAQTQETCLASNAISTDARKKDLHTHPGLENPSAKDESLPLIVDCNLASILTMPLRPELSLEVSGLKFRILTCKIRKSRVLGSLISNLT